MALNVANVELTDSFNTWRLRTNEVIAEAASANDFTTFVANTTFDAPTTFNANTIFNAGIVSNYLSVTGDIDGTDISGINITGDTVTGNVLDGILSTAAQPNITSVGTLTTLTMSGGITGVTTLSMSGALTGVTTIAASDEIEGGSLDINGAASIAGAVTDVTDLTASGTVTALDFNSTSDVRLKTNVKNINNAVDKVMKLDGVYFNWIDSGEDSIGVIAQQIEQVIPEAVITNDEGFKSVSYGKLVGLLIEAIKEQQIVINKMQNNL